MVKSVYYVTKDTEGEIKYLGTIDGVTNKNTYYESNNLALEFNNLETAQAVAEWASSKEPDAAIGIAKMTCTISFL